MIAACGRLERPDCIVMSRRGYPEPRHGAQHGASRWLARGRRCRRSALHVCQIYFQLLKSRKGLNRSWHSAAAWVANQARNCTRSVFRTSPSAGDS